LSSPLVTTVVITRNRRDQLLASLGAASGRVIVVDNGSSDGTSFAVRRHFPDVRLIRLRRNAGALARNVGVAAVCTPYVAFSDDDSWWAPGALSEAVEYLERHGDWALVAARVLVGPRETPDPVSEGMRTSALPIVDDAGHKLVVGFLACAAVARVSAVREVGGFDRVIFFGGEEERVAIDLLSKGWLLVHVPSVVAHHHPCHGASAQRRELLACNAVLTAVMRRPWVEVMRRVHRGVRQSGWHAILLASRRLPLALARRRPVPAYVEEYLREP
jgi:GT2 family glycosyltransferase